MNPQLLLAASFLSFVSFVFDLKIVIFYEIDNSGFSEKSGLVKYIIDFDTSSCAKIR
jgi:hypothetical protein